MTNSTSKQLNLVVSEGHSGWRLDQFLAAVDPDLSRARIKGLVDQGLAQVNGARGKASTKVKAGQTVTLVVPAVMPPDLTPDGTVVFEILYQDSDLVVINKPPGLVVHPAVGHERGTLVHGLLAACEDLTGIGGEARPGIVHRLDKDTSGVMVVAKTEAVHKALVEIFKNRQVSKIYLALTRGWPKNDRGDRSTCADRTASGPAPEDVRHDRPVRTSGFNPVDQTWYVRFALNLSLLRLLKILTGRTHQIRVHLAALMVARFWAIRIYGQWYTGALKNGGGSLSRGSVNRGRCFMLIACLGLTHPVTGQEDGV